MYVIIGRKEGFVLSDPILITGVTGALHPRGIFHPKIVIYLLFSKPAKLLANHFGNSFGAYLLPL